MHHFLQQLALQYGFHTPFCFSCKMLAFPFFLRGILQPANKLVAWLYLLLVTHPNHLGKLFQLKDLMAVTIFLFYASKLLETTAKKRPCNHGVFFART